jgi:drug/metabolite transporter (DMT)-like permease
MVALPIAAVYCLFHWVTPQGLDWLWLLCVGISTQIGQVSITRALTLDAAGRNAAYSYVQVPLAALWGALFFDALPNPFSLAGALLILGGAVLNLRTHATR